MTEASKKMRGINSLDVIPENYTIHYNESGRQLIEDSYDEFGRKPAKKTKRSELLKTSDVKKLKKMEKDGKRKSIKRKSIKRKSKKKV